jgi:hypothetical protein
MPKHIYLALAFHSHQPVGNFDHIFTEAYERAYLPMIKCLERHPGFRLALHYTGPLRDWLVENRPKFLGRVRALVARGQVEMMTGGYYEPILVSVPDSDKAGQIAKLTQAVKDDFGYEPTGAWLAERVWEPHLAKPMAEAGIEYTIVDDTHFRYVGLEDEDLLGYYVTEEQGVPLKIFGTSKKLRYTIPWAEVEEVIAYLREMATEAGDRVAVMGDDGEKFGLWPMTWEHVWNSGEMEGGWMERFCQALEANSDWLTTIPPGEFARRFPAKGRVYLPTASYDEMTEWSLPAHLAAEITHLKHRLEEEGRQDILRFVKGGFWRNFLAKYEEVNNLHKKMLWVSEKVHGAIKSRGAAATPSLAARLSSLKSLPLRGRGDTTSDQEALDHLWAGQCNCPYWHGVFGGIYLSHIRTANYQHLIRAETLADAITHGRAPWVQVYRFDFDRDSKDEVLIESDRMNCYLAPHRGGHLFEWDWREGGFNLLNGFTRRQEGYHRDLKEAAEQGNIISPDQGTGLASIHTALVRVKEPGLEKKLFYDWYRRVGLIDHFLPSWADLSAFARADFGETGDFVSEPFQMEVEEGTQKAVVTLSREGGVWVADTGEARLAPTFAPLRVTKRLTVASGSQTLPVVYTLTNLWSEPLNLRFGVEWNFGLLSGHTDDAYYQVPGDELDERHLDSAGELADNFGIDLVHEWFDIRVSLRWDRPATLWRTPVETISNSEAGFERVYQASCVMPLWSVQLDPWTSWKVRLDLAIAPGRL